MRAIQAGLEEAEGEISEEALADTRVRKQTATGSAEVETDLEDEDTGRVVAARELEADVHPKALGAWA